MRLRFPALWFSCSVALGALALSPEMGCGGGGDITLGTGGATTSTTSTSTGSTTGSTTSSTSSVGGGGSGGSGGATCGNGKVEGTEECDDGNQTNGDGCENDCSFTCIAGVANRDHCDDGNACNGTETCGADHKCAPGTALNQGDACGTGKVCVGGNCVAPSCGDALVEAPEECDDGNATAGDGCESNCKFSCVSTDPTRNCSNPDPCAGNGTCNDTAHTCTPGTPLADGTACGSGKQCKAGVCTLATCGNGVVDPGEQCDPPNGTTCSATCQNITVPGCGNGVIDPGEQCDDGNTFNLDGCDSNCKYEVVNRMTAVSIQGGPAPSFCTPTTNRLGTQSITSQALSQLNTPLQQGIDDGTTNIIAQILGLDDLTGVADSNGFSVGVMAASPDPAKGTWPGNNPIDWWFRVDHTTVNAQGLPTGVLGNGTLAARALAAGPSDVNLTLLLGGVPALLHMRNTRIAATLDGTPAPNTPAPPPTQLASGLKVFQTMTATGTGQGLCGNITVDSLAQIPVPQTLAMGGGAACGACPGSHQYTYCGANQPVGPNCNSLLDVLVGGCKALACFFAVVNPQQPDVPAMSGGTVTTLTLGTNSKIPTSQTTGDNDAYSAYLKFSANRAHLTSENCSTTADCQTGKTCMAGVCK